MTHETDLGSIDQGNRLDEDTIRDVVELYQAQLKKRTEGPQLEGIEGENLAEVLRNEPENVLLLDLIGDDGEVKGKWPLLLPVAYHQDYSQDFVRNHFEDEPVYFFSLPPYDDIEGLLASPDSLDRVSDFLSSRQAVIAYDYREGDDAKELIPGFLEKVLENRGAQLNDITPESKSDAWKMNYGLPEVVFFEGRAQLLDPPEEPLESIQAAIEHMIAEHEIEVLPESGPTFISAEQLRANEGKLLDRMWEMYNAQFNILVEDHPALFQQPKEEFFDTLLDPDTVNVAFMHEGKPVGLLYLVSNIEKCAWLNKDYYAEKYNDDESWVAFYPGVVVAADMAQKDMGFIQEMMNAVSRVAEKTGKDLILAFACSNISKTYIPKIVETFVESNYPDEERRLKYPQRARLQKDESGRGIPVTATYKYRVARVTSIED